MYKDKCQNTAFFDNSRAITRDHGYIMTINNNNTPIT